MKIAPNVGLKIMCHLAGLGFVAEASQEVKVAVTGVFSPSQAYLAAQAGAHYIIPYVNRFTPIRRIRPESDRGHGEGHLGDPVRDPGRGYQDHR